MNIFKIFLACCLLFLPLQEVNVGSACGTGSSYNYRSGQKVCSRCGRVHGQPDTGGWKPSSTVPQYEWKQIVKVRISEGEGVHSIATGVIVRDEGSTHVLTVWHAFRNWKRGPVYIVANGQQYQAQVIDLNQSADLALLKCMSLGIKPLPIALESPSGSVCIWGYGYGENGPLRRVVGRLLRLFINKGGAQTIVIGCGVVGGYSGGPLLNKQGQVVGIIWGSVDGKTYGTTCITIRRLFGRYLIIHQPQLIPVPGTPQVENPTLDPTSNELQEIRDRLAKLEVNIDSKFISIQSQVNEIKINIETQPPLVPVEPFDQDQIIDEVYNKLKPDINNLEDMLTKKLEAIQNKIDQLPTGSLSEEDKQNIINEILNRLGNTDTAPRILYFTVEGLSQCDKTDAMAMELRNGGYPITIITLHPQDTSVVDVPRVFVPKTQKELRGISNIVTYFSSLTL